MRNPKGLDFKKLKSVLGIEETKTAIIYAENQNIIPKAHRIKQGNIHKRVWDYSQIPLIGDKYGFLKQKHDSKVVTFFSQKGGVFKTTIALNFARINALHNKKTILIDFDPQGDSTKALGLGVSEQEINNLAEVDKILDSINGLYDYVIGSSDLEDIIQTSEIPNLHCIPSTSDLIPLMHILSSKDKREYWIKDNLVHNLKNMGYDLIIIDLPPSWSIYSSNSLVASDVLISPIECQAINYRNASQSILYLNHFIEKFGLSNLEMLFVPVKTDITSLRRQVKQWYLKNIEHCSLTSIRSSVVADEAMVKRLSLLEYAPKKDVSIEMRDLLIEINSILTK